MSIPDDSFRHSTDRAHLRVEHLPIPDTFFFANNVSVSAEIDVDVTWAATAAPVERGKGSSVPADDWAAFTGHFSDATCRGRGAGRETGFHFQTGPLSERGFFAQLGYERNGAFLS